MSFYLKLLIEKHQPSLTDFKKFLFIRASKLLILAHPQYWNGQKQVKRVGYNWNN